MLKVFHAQVLSGIERMMMTTWKKDIIEEDEEVIKLAQKDTYETNLEEFVMQEIDHDVHFCRAP